MWCVWKSVNKEKCEACGCVACQEYMFQVNKLWVTFCLLLDMKIYLTYLNHYDWKIKLANEQLYSFCTVLMRVQECCTWKSDCLCFKVTQSWLTPFLTINLNWYKLGNCKISSNLQHPSAVQTHALYLGCFSVS